jgi:ABC-type phosphate/phosphonate transport system substrate-binding protein
MRKLNWKPLILFYIFCLLLPAVAAAADITLYFPPNWKDDAPKAKGIAEAMSRVSGLTIQPRIANSYPEIIEAFAKGQPVLTYAGSFVQAVLHGQGLSSPLLQGVDGRESYTGVFIAPKSSGSDPVKIVKEAGEEIAFSKAASSGESAAMAATGGKAAIPTNSHAAAVNAVKVNKAKGAFVKDWWWEDNKAKYEDMAKFDYPEVSSYKNPDNILSASKSIPTMDMNQIKNAALKNAAAFGVKEFREVSASQLEPSLALMNKGKINPATYKW